MIKKVIYVISAAVLSFSAESMTQTYSMMQTEQPAQYESFFQLIHIENPAAQHIEGIAPEQLRQSIRVQMCMLEQLFGSRKDPATGRTIIDLSCKNFEASIDSLLLKCTEEDQKKDSYLKMSALMKRNENTQGEPLTHSDFVDLCCNELFDLSYLSEPLRDKVLSMLSMISVPPIGKERLKSMLYMRWLSDISELFISNNKKIIVYDWNYTHCNIGSFAVLRFDFENVSQKKCFLIDTQENKMENLPYSESDFQLSVNFFCELSRIYHRHFFCIPSSIAFSSALNDAALGLHMFPTHNKNIFDDICSDFAKKLARANQKTKLQKDIIDTIVAKLNDYRKRLKSYTAVDKFHLPIGHLLPDDDILTDATGIVAAKIMVATFLSINSSSIQDDRQPSFAEHLWREAENMLEIFGIMPIDIGEEKFAIIDYQNENIFRSCYPNVYRHLFYGKVFDAEHISRILNSMDLHPLLKQGNLLTDLKSCIGGKSTKPDHVISEYLSHILMNKIMKFESPYKIIIQQINPPIEATRVFKMGKIANLGIADLPRIPGVFFNFVRENLSPEFKVGQCKRSLLHLAIRAGMPCSFIKAMIESTPEEYRSKYIQEADLYGETPLSIACYNGDIEIFNLLKSSVPQEQFKILLFTTIVGLATGNTKNAIIDELCMINSGFGNKSNGAALDEITDKSGDTLLYAAVQYAQPIVVSHFLENLRLNPNIPNKRGYTPMVEACSNGEINIIKSLVKAKADIKYIDKNQNTLLHIAVDSDQFKVVEYLLETLRLDPNKYNIVGNTPLAIACAKRSVEMIKILIKNKARTDCTDNINNTILNIAVLFDNLDAVNYILEKLPVGINQPNNIGCSPIMNASLNGSTKIVRSLIKRKADITCMLPILNIIVVKKGHIELARYLMSELIKKNPELAENLMSIIPQ